ncbi:hypothetical protein LTR17_011920 [Elasticomyces elasticus]|nr:hypothetical protein LTR17_011920 [Elasticomyces elasticus]
MAQRDTGHSRQSPPGQRADRRSASPATNGNHEEALRSPRGAIPELASTKSKKTEHKLRFSLDYGTRTLASAVKIVGPGHDPDQVPSLLHFGLESWAPQKAGWSDSGDFFWGYGVASAVKSGTLRVDQVIELWKLLLYTDHATSMFAEKFRTQLEGRSFQYLLVTHMAYILGEVKKLAKDSPAAASFSDTELGMMDVELFLSVPQMWKAPANLQMTKAAREAGFDFVRLVYKPQCAAGFFTENVKHLSRGIVVGDVAIVADIGGGTGDFVSLEYKSSRGDGAQVQLEVVGVPQGALCGSEFVTERCLDWVIADMNREESFDVVCARLGISVADGTSQLKESFELVKCTFDGTETQPAVLLMRNSGGESWAKIIPSADIVTFFTPVFETIVGCIKAQMTDHTKVVIIPGGFGRSEYLLAVLKSRFPGLEINGQASRQVGGFQPIATGALCRYRNVHERGIPSTESFGIGQIEHYDAKVHHDANLLVGRPSKATQPNKAIVVRDNFTGDRILYDRFVPLLKKGDEKMPGRRFDTAQWQEAYIYKGQKDHTQQVYWTESNIQLHGPIFVPGTTANDEGAKPIAGIERWGDPLVFILPDLARMGFKPVSTHEKGCPAFRIFYQLSMACDGANVSVSFRIAKPRTRGEFNPQGAVFDHDDLHTILEDSYNTTPLTIPS